jgi:hypothetical protein
MVLPLYAHKFSPKKFTQPQLFACLVFKEFMRRRAKRSETLQNTTYARFPKAGIVCDTDSHLILAIIAAQGSAGWAMPALIQRPPSRNTGAIPRAAAGSAAVDSRQTSPQARLGR